MNDIIKKIHWNDAASLPALDDRSLHLWRIPIGPSGGDTEALKSLLSPLETERAERLRLPKHRDRYVRAHAGLRRILAIYLRVAPEEIGYSYGSAGKPELAGATRAPRFNLTTSADLALLAVSATLPVGIDCEQVRERKYLIDIAKRMFPPEAVRSICEAPKREQLECFYRAWTALEARVKEDGRGLFAGGDETSDTLSIAHFAPEQGQIAAVARKNLPATDEWATLQIGCD